MLGLADGRKVYPDVRLDTYFRAFNGNILLRESCYQCRYVGAKRIADFTLADFWGVTDHYTDAEQREKGVSFLIVSTDKAKRIMHEISNLVIRPAKVQDAACYNMALEKANSRPEARTNMYANIERYGFDRAVKKLYRRFYITARIKSFIGEKRIAGIRRILKR